MKKQKNQLLTKIEITIAVVVILAGFLAFFSYYGITGFVSIETKTQQLNLVVSQSKSFTLTSNNEKPYILTSFRISGKITGKGFVEMYLLDAAGQKILVYNNIYKKTTPMSVITGAAVAKEQEVLYEKEELDKMLLLIPEDNLQEIPKTTLAADEETKAESFNNACEDSCFIEMQMSSNHKYSLIALVEPGTEVKLTKIGYTIQED